MDIIQKESKEREANLQKEINDIRNEVAEHQREIDDLRGKLAAQEKESKKTETNLKEMNGIRSQFEEKVYDQAAERKKEIDNLRRQLADQEEENNNLVKHLGEKSITSRNSMKKKNFKT